MKKALLYTKKLETAGLDRELAEAHVGILEEIFEDEMATKADLEKLRTDLTGEMKVLQTEVRADIRALQSDLKIIDQKTTVKFGIMTVASATFIISVLSLIRFL